MADRPTSTRPRIAAVLAFLLWLGCSYASFALVTANGALAQGTLAWWTVLYATVLVAVIGGAVMANAAARTARHTGL